MTTENNKIIAEFMGAKTDINVYHEIGSKMGKFDLWLPKHGIVVVSHLKYHSDWNWLMEVVEKIANIKSWSINATLEYLSESQDRDGLYTINDIYEAGLEFIKCYLENSAKEN